MDRPIFTLYDFETIDFTALLLCFLQKQQFEYTTSDTSPFISVSNN